MMNVSRFLRRFRDNEHGAAALETIIIIPLMFWAYLSMYSYFHAYRTHSLNIKTAYAIGDVISRQTTPIDQAYLEGVHELAAYMSWTERSSFTLRITSVVYDEEANEYRRDWSEVKGSKPPLSNSDVNNLRSSLPVMPDGERLVLVETFKQYDPPFNMGLSDHEIHNFVFTRPRYAPRVCFDECEGV
ncbi:TadE/TadG family type IV pilus assembly protein [Tateyamaria sp. SN6-1]|uniref:TadE/TadG family type IV pilus assembly protein n=1 Tax=Tateyamaria sp. SN6-1 TaxID=3092148 RepID=UPI0039F63825